MIEASQFVLDTPKMQCVIKTQGSHQTVSSELTPREFHPNCRSDRAALIACDAFNARTIDWTGVSLSSLWVMAKSGAVRFFQSAVGSPPFIARCYLTGLGVPLYSLMLIWVTKRMYLANDYSVVKEQTRFRHTKENRVRVFVLSPCSPWESAFLDTIPKYF